MGFTHKEYYETIKEYPLDKRIAIIADFDLTLTEQFQQEPILAAYLDNIKKAYDGKTISMWVHGRLKETKIKIEKPGDWFRLSDAWAEPHNGVAWVSQFLYDIRTGVLPPLSKREMFEVWAPKIKLSPGFPEVITNLREEFNGKCYIGFYIASVGITDLISGTSAGDIIDYVFASDLVSLEAIHKFPNEIDKQSTMPVDYAREIVKPFGKTECVIKIAKGAHEKLDDLVRNEDLSFSYKNMIYLGDGTSDVSTFAYLQKKGSTVLCVYEEGNMDAYGSAIANPKLFPRIEGFFPRNYEVGSPTWTQLVKVIDKKLSRKCSFPSQMLDLYKKRRLDPETEEHKGLLKVISGHLKNCRECEGTYSVKWVPPR